MNSNPIPINDTDAQNFPMIIWLSFIGSVANSSIVPVFFSREIKPIVMAGTKKRNRSGMIPKRVRKLAWLFINNGLAKNHPLNNKKITSTM